MPDAADLNALRPVVQAFQALDIEFYVGGSVASNVYGVWRTTMDTDLVAVLKPEHIATLVARLSEQYYIDAQMIHNALKHQMSFNIIHNDTAQKIDVFPAGRRPFDEQVRRRATMRAVSEDGRFEIPVASPEDVILTKLEWHRLSADSSVHQFRDVVGVMKAQKGRLDQQYLRRWAAELNLSDLLDRAWRESLG